ncbi:blue-light-activated protein [bacterium BMS3Abin03]|nr:blue-light-activated protein [bacterium BMS3Abin03]
MTDKLKFNFNLFNNFPDMYFLLSFKGEIILMNSSVKRLIEEDENPASFKYLFDLIQLCDRSEAEDLFRKCVEEKTSTHYQTKFYINNKLINVTLSCTHPIRTIDSELSDYVIAIARDISEEKKKELELVRFHNVAEGSVNPVQITDLNGKMIYVNPAFIKVSGYSKDELIGENPRIFGSGKHPNKFWAKVWKTISSGKVWFGEIEDKRKNGEPFYSQLLISPIMDKDGKVTGYFGIHRDISDKRVLEKQLIHTQKMESIGTLAAGIAHEVGNPLASISALVQVVQRNTKEQFTDEKLGLIKSQVTRISKIIRDLVDFSRPSNYELKSININKSLKETVEITRVGTKAKDIEFNVKLSNEIPVIPLIPDQIEQVFLNILINAVDAITEMNSNDRKKRIDVESFINGNEVVINIIDNGHGIEEENLNKIFEPFFTTKGQGKGTGLGLWVSYGIMKSFQGDIKVKSKAGEGTTFQLTLPIDT